MGTCSATITPVLKFYCVMRVVNLKFFAQTVHSLENNNFLLKLSSDGEWGRGLGAEKDKDTALLLVALSHLSSHLNQHNYFFHIHKDSRISPEKARISSIYLQFTQQ